MKFIISTPITIPYIIFEPGNWWYIPSKGIIYTRGQFFSINSKFKSSWLVCNYKTIPFPHLYEVIIRISKPKTTVISFYNQIIGQTFISNKKIIMRSPIPKIKNLPIIFYTVPPHIKRNHNRKRRTKISI